MEPIYNNIGKGYSKHRCADPRIVQTLAGLLDLAPPATLADIGAGTGNYSRAVADRGFRVLAVDPSTTMHKQALPHAAVDWHMGTAEQIPLPTGSVDGVLCVLASHHFSSLEAALCDMARICSSGPIIWFTFDPRLAEDPWLQDYFPEVWKNAFELFPKLEDLQQLFESHTHRHVSVTPWLIPHDLQDYFMAAAWRTPEMYLDPEVRAGMSGLALAESLQLQKGLSRLHSEIENGAWKAKYGHLLEREAIDWGYRFLKAV